MKALKMIGLVAVGASALMAMLGTAGAVVLTGNHPPLSPLAIGLLFTSLCTLSAAALRIGKSPQCTPSTSLTHCQVTFSKTNSKTDTVTVSPQLRAARPNPQYDREALLIIPVMAC